MMSIQKQQIRENTNLIQMQGMSPDEKLIEGGAMSNIRMFSRANWDKTEARLAFESGKNIDQRNEKRPGL